MDWKDVLEHAKKAGEERAFEWWTSDHSDGPVNPAGSVHVEVTDPEHASQLLALGEATVVEGGARLTAAWEHDGDRLEYARAFARAFSAVLKDRGVPTRLVEELASDRLDTSSLERGLEQLMHLGRISVADFVAERPVVVTRVSDGPFVLELDAELRAHPSCSAFLDRLREQGHQVREQDAGTRVNLGRDAKAVVPIVVDALATLRDSPTTTLVARFAPGRAQRW